MAAIVILLFGILVWSIFGTVSMRSADGTETIVKYGERIGEKV